MIMTTMVIIIPAAAAVGSKGAFPRKRLFMLTAEERRHDARATREGRN
jgi:hypothetical protein